LWFLSLLIFWTCSIHSQFLGISDIHRAHITRIGCSSTSNCFHASHIQGGRTVIMLHSHSSGRSENNHREQDQKAGVVGCPRQPANGQEVSFQCSHSIAKLLPRSSCDAPARPPTNAQRTTSRQLALSRVLSLPKKTNHLFPLRDPWRWASND